MSDKGHNCLEVGLAHVPECAQNGLKSVLGPLNITKHYLN